MPMRSKRLAIAAALSLGLHSALLISIFFWLDKPYLSAETAIPSVLSVRLTSLAPDLDSDAKPSNSTSPAYQSPRPPNAKSASSTPSASITQTDLASPPPSSQAGIAPPAPAVRDIPSASSPSFQPSTPISIPKPTYPLRARRRGLEGIVLIRLDIDATGALSSFEFIPPRSDPLLEESVLASLENLLFLPATNQGQPVRSVLSLKFRFELED